MALDVEWALSRSSVLLVNRLARSKSECLNFNALGALAAQPNRLQNRLFLANVTKPSNIIAPLAQRGVGSLEDRKGGKAHHPEARRYDQSDAHDDYLRVS